MMIIEKMAAIMAGSLLVGVGINFFLIPYHLLDGGMIGIGLIIHYFLGLPTGLGVILSSIPLYIYAWYYEKKLFLNSLHGLLFLFVMYRYFFRGCHRLESSHLYKCHNRRGINRAGNRAHASGMVHQQAGPTCLHRSFPGKAGLMPAC